MADSQRQEGTEAAQIEQYVNITGADKESAKHVLEAFSWNLESAINMYLEGSAGGTTIGTSNEDDISEVLSASSSHPSTSSLKRRQIDKSNSNPIIVDDQINEKCNENTERLDIY